MKPPSDQGLRGVADEGEARNRDALERFRVRQRAYLRSCQRLLLDVLLVRGEGTTDDVRERLPLPSGINPKTIGAIPGELVDVGIIFDSGRVEKSRRPEAHARKITVWQLADRRAAQQWLDEHPELPPPSNDDGEETTGSSSRKPSPPSAPTPSASATQPSLF